MIGKKSDDLDEKLGYYGERLVLEAQALGLNTCWVGLTYSKQAEHLTIGKDEKLVCVIALGYGATQGVTHRIMRCRRMVPCRLPPRGRVALARVVR